MFDIFLIKIGMKVTLLTEFLVWKLNYIGLFDNYLTKSVTQQFSKIKLSKLKRLK